MGLWQIIKLIPRSWLWQKVGDSESWELEHFHVIHYLLSISHMTFNSSKLCELERANWLTDWIASGWGVSLWIPILTLQLGWGWGAHVNIFTWYSFSLLNGFLSPTPSALCHEAMKTTVSASFDSSVLNRSPCLFTTLHLLVLSFPECSGNISFLQLQFCFNIFLEFAFFFYLCVKNTCLDEGKLDQCSAYFTGHHFCGKNWFVPSFLVELKALNQATNGGEGVRFLQFWGWPLLHNIKVEFSFDENFMVFSQVSWTDVKIRVHSFQSGTGLHGFIYKIHGKHVFPCFPCMLICILGRGWKRLHWELLPAIILRSEVFRSAYHFSLFQATWLKFFSLFWLLTFARWWGYNFCALRELWFLMVRCNSA